LNYADGEKRYIIAPIDLKVGDKVMSSKSLIEIKTGNALTIQFIPAGLAVSAVELEPGQGAKIARGAGNVVYVMGVEGKYAQLKMPSGEIRKVKRSAFAPSARRVIRRDVTFLWARPAAASLGLPPDRPRYGDESGRSPSWWR
jgi:hypothetical protein